METSYYFSYIYLIFIVETLEHKFYICICIPWWCIVETEERTRDLTYTDSYLIKTVIDIKEKSEGRNIEPKTLKM